MSELISELTLVDYVFIIIILMSGVLSLFRGFVKESVSLVSLLLAIWVVWTFDVAFAEVLAPWLTDQVIRIWGARILLFIFVLVAGGVVASLLYMLLNKSGLTVTDRIFGSFFGLARGVLLVAVLIVVLEMIGFAKSAWWQQSKLIPYAAPVTKQLRKLAQGGLDYIGETAAPAVPEQLPEGSGE
jgi:membrane protein required for colicin V production